MNATASKRLFSVSLANGVHLADLEASSPRAACEKAWDAYERAMYVTTMQDVERPMPKGIRAVPV